MDPLTQLDLNDMQCTECGDTAGCSDHGFVFHASCHIEAPTWVDYLEGVLTVTCSVCEKEVAKVRVASGEQEGLIWN